MNKAALVVYSLSRLCRSTRDAINIAERLDKNGADLVSLSEKIDTTSASGRMIFRMLAVLAEFERDQIAERTRAALAHKRAKGEVTGAVPFGYRVADNGTTLLPDATEQRTLRIIGRLLAQGLSQRRIVVELNARGFRTKQGNLWNRNSLRSVLRTQARMPVAA
jgi:DNA invertase Pin-like site-specific DNA recombinase